jgi:hypothetical protein
MAEGMASIGTYSASYGDDRVFLIGKIGYDFAFTLVSEKPSHNDETWHMDLFSHVNI